MIVKMKKVTLVLPGAHIDAHLTDLGQLGVVHLQPFQPPVDESIDRVSARIEEMQKSIGILKSYNGDAPDGVERDKTLLFSRYERPRGEVDVMQEILSLAEGREKLVVQESELQSQIDWYGEWGVVSPKDVQKLENEGIFLYFFRLDEKAWKTVSNRADLRILRQRDGQNFLLQVTRDVSQKLAFEESVRPPISAKLAGDNLKSVKTKLSENRKTLLELTALSELLEEALQERKRRFDVRQVQFAAFSVDDKFRIFQGFTPVDQVDAVVSLAKQSNWGYIVSDPTEEDLENIPTLIRSPRWVERIKPVMNFMGLVPGYKELDVSAVFMLFFTFFTGILVGDAGYGLIFLLITFLAHRKKKFKPDVVFGLMYTLSVSILFWGTLTGTYFGSPEIAKIPWLSALVVKKIASFGGDNQAAQQVMFVIGAIHLSVGHLQTAWKYSNSIRAIGQIGWVAIVWVLYLVVNQMVLGQEAPAITLPLFIVGVVLVTLFSHSGTSFAKGMISSLGNLPLSIISGFSDVISYIRLYAVGLSTVLLAQSFNQMAIGDGLTTIVSFIGAVLILIVGHGLNMVLAAMAVIVHGVRLNMLEYAGHASVEFSGAEYVPFKVNQKTSN